MRPADIMPETIAQLAHRDKSCFERFAIDLLEWSGEVKGRLIRVDLPTGRTDGGFDAQLIGVFRELSGSIRVSVKGNGDWRGLSKDHRRDISAHPDSPVLLLCAISLDIQERNRLSQMATEMGVPGQEVVDAGQLAAWARGVAYHVALPWLGGASTSPVVSLDYALFGCLIKKPSRTTPMLQCEAEAIDTVVKGLSTADSGIITLTLRTHFDRPAHVVRSIANRLASEGVPYPACWIREDARPGESLREAVAKVSAHRRGEPTLYVTDLALGLPGDVVGDILHADEHAVLLLIGAFRAIDIAKSFAQEHRPFSPPVAVELREPTPQEMREWLATIFPHSQNIWREAVLHHVRLAPGVAESLSAGIGVLDRHIRSAFGGSPTADRNVGTLGWIALRESWEYPPNPVWSAWVAKNRRVDPAEIEYVLREAERVGVFRMFRGSLGEEVPSRIVPASEAIRYALVRTASELPWGPSVENLVQAIEEATVEVYSTLISTLVECYPWDTVEPLLNRALRGPQRIFWAIRLAEREHLSESVGRQTMSVLRSIFEDGAEHGELQRLLTRVAEKARGALVADALPIAIKNREYSQHRRQEAWVTQVIEQMLEPQTLGSLAAADVADVIAEGLETAGDHQPLWFETAERFIRYWLAAAVEHRQSAGNMLSLSVAAWANNDPYLNRTWSRAAALVETLVRVAPDRGWVVVQGLGREICGRENEFPEVYALTMETLIDQLIPQIPSSQFPKRRIVAEDALLQTTRAGWSQPHILAKVIRIRETTPLFSAWRCIQDPTTLILDAERAVVNMHEEGAQRWWRRLFKDNHYLFLKADPILVERLAQLGLQGTDFANFLQTLEVGPGQAGVALIGAWMHQQPNPFVELFHSARLYTLPTEIRSLLYAGAMHSRAEAVLSPLRSMLASGPRTDSENVGVLAEIKRLLTEPGSVPDEEANMLIDLTCEVASATEVGDTLLVLAAHPGVETRAKVALSAINAANRGHLLPAKLKAVAWRLTGPPTTLQAFEPLLLSAPDESHEPSIGWGEIEDVLVARLLEWINSPCPSAIISPSDALRLTVPFCRLMADHPTVWWRWAVLLEPPLIGSFGLTRNAPIAALESALAAGPDSTPIMSKQARIMDHLVRGLTEERFIAITQSAIATNDFPRAELLILARGLKLCYLGVVEHLVICSPQERAEEQINWGKRLVKNLGATGMTSSIFAVPLDWELSGAEVSIPHRNPVTDIVRQWAETHQNRRIRQFARKICDLV